MSPATRSRSSTRADALPAVPQRRPVKPDVAILAALHTGTCVPDERNRDHLTGAADERRSDNETMA
jgi:hypothetical protein